MPVLDGIIGTETIGDGTIGRVTTGDILIPIIMAVIPIIEAEEVLPTPPIRIRIEITTPEIQKTTLETKAIPLTVETILMVEETQIPISEEILQTDLIGTVQHFQEIKDNRKTTRITIQVEEEVVTLLATKATDRKDPILQVQQTIIIQDRTALAIVDQAVPEDLVVAEILEVVEDHPEVAVEAVEDKQDKFPFFLQY
jgi:hypothetical protein